MELHIVLSDLMYVIDSETEFDSYGCFFDSVVGMTPLIWDKKVDGADDWPLF